MLFSTATMGKIQRLRLQGAITVGRTLGVGGDAWTIERLVGGGPNAARVWGTQGPVEPLYVYQHRAARPQSDTGPVAEQDDEWRYVAVGNPDLKAGDRLTSVSDGNWKFVIKTLDRPLAGYVVGVAEIAP